MKRLSSVTPKSGLLIKPIHTAMMLAFCTLSTGMVYASCGANTTSQTSPVNCTPATGDATLSTDGITIDVSTTNAGISAVSTDGNTTVNIHDTTINENTPGRAHGVNARMSGATGNTLVTMTGTNHITLSANADTGMVVGSLGNTPTGNATLNISGNLTVTNNADNSGSYDGLEINTNGGLGKLVHTGSGTITVHGGNAVVVSSGSGATDVQLGSGVSLLVDNTVSSAANFTNSGIKVSGSAGINVQTGANIETRGDKSHGIYASNAVTSDTTITNTGNITIGGNGTAIRVGSVGGNVTVNQNGGNLVINGAVTNGAIYNSTGGAGTATVNMNGGTLTSNSTDSRAHGLESRAAGSGDAIVNLNAGSVTTMGGLGIAAWNGNTGTGNAKVTTAAGTIINALGTTTGAEGIFAKGTNVEINSQSAIFAHAVGIEGESIGSGTVTIKQTGGNITSGADGIRGTSAGVVDIVNSGIIQTSGAGGYGIHGTSNGSTVTIDNRNNITTSGAGAHAIFAQGGTGLSTIDNYAILTTTGDNSKGIAANFSGTSGGITVNHHAGASIITNGNNAGSGGYSLVNGSAGILISSTTTSVGDLLAIVDGDITTHGENRAGGVFVNNVGVGNATIYATGNILTTSATGPYSYGLSANIGNQTTSRGDASIYYTNAAGTVETRANDSAALYTYIDTNANGNVRIENAGTLKTFGDGISPGIWARVLNGGGSATVINSGAITTTGAMTGNGSPSAIRADTVTGNVDVTNRGALSTQGDQASGIRVNTGNASSISVGNTGAITTAGSTSRGINVFASTSGNINVASSGNITTSGPTLAGGVLVNSSNAHITSDISGNISTVGTYSPAVELISARNSEGTTSNSLYYHDGTATIGAGSNAISLWSGGAATGSGDVHIGANTFIDASRGLSAVQNLMPEDGLISIDAGARILGGSDTNNAGVPGSVAAGVDLNSARGTLNNSGEISSMNDVAIRNNNSATQSTVLNNRGILTGNITLASGANSLDNSGQWNLRHFADTNSDQIRDTLAVAVSDFGSSGNNSVTNSGVIALLGDNGQATTLDNTGAYSTGYAANTMAISGAVQGQILNVKSFSNSGTIDMGPANGAVGDVLLISGGNTPGVSGGGTYVANGGRMILDTVLNEGGTNSQSDMLVVDGTQLGNAADKISVINVGGTGSITVGNGIELVRVLDKDRSAGGVFKLDGRLVSGLYEYDLHQGGVGADATDGNWYLRSVGKGDTPRAESGVYLRNMTAASTMFMHTLHDRLGEPQYTDKYKDETNGKVSSLWVRVVGSHTDGSAAEGRIDLDTDTTLVHLGGDLARWSSDGNDRWHVGVMGAYGQSDTDAGLVQERVANNGMQRTANGKVDGYSVGAYATWYGNQDKPTGLYVDLWGQYAWFNNSVKGNGLKEEKYDSTGYTLSAETGYAFVAHDGEKRQWMIEPQAQIAYNSYSADDHYERTTNTWVRNGDSDGVIGRLGARVYSRSRLGDNGMQPFVEANWWYNSAKYDLSFNGARVNDDTPDSTFELKAGLQGEIAKNWQMWGHIGGRWGAHDYRSYEGMVGVKYQF